MPLTISNMTVGQQKLKMFPIYYPLLLLLLFFTWKINIFYMFSLFFVLNGF